MTQFIYNKDYKHLQFLKEKSRSFHAWVCPLFKANVVMDNSYVYFEGDEIENIYFIKNGSCSYVLPKHANARYISIQKGYCFGLGDIIYSMMKSKIDMSQIYNNREQLIRQFTIRSSNKLCTNLLTLSIQDLNRMKMEFQESYEKFFTDEEVSMLRIIKIKYKAIVQLSKKEKIF